MYMFSRTYIINSSMRNRGKVLILCLLVSFLWHLNTWYQRQEKLDPNAKPKTAPIVFVGGHESTGTTLLRMLLDAHPMVRCGTEPTVPLHFLRISRNRFGISQKFLTSLKLYPDVFEKANAIYVLEFTKLMGSPAPVLCHKQPGILHYLPLLADWFPKAKFINLIRDGRGAIESSMRRGLYSHRNDNDALKALTQWESTTRRFLLSCQNVGIHRCLTVRYEELVMRPKLVMQRVLNFIDIPWNPIVLEHHKHLNNVPDLFYSLPSTEHAIKGIELSSLNHWYYNKSILPNWLKLDAHKRSKLLVELGYASLGLPPNYTKLSFPVPLLNG